MNALASFAVPAALLACLACLPVTLSDAIPLEASESVEFDEDVRQTSNARNDNSSGTGPFIIGGRDAARNQFPSAIHLQTANSWCGGVIIDRNWVLTAAHCIDRAQVERTSVVAGTTRNNDGSGTRIGASQFRIHSGYNRASLTHDIALIRLRQPLTFSQSVQAAPLWASPVGAGQSTVVVGWGATSNGGSGSSTLKFADLVIVSRDQCNRVYGSITADKICAAAPPAHQGHCSGDSGGPLYANGWLVGIVSASAKDNCAHPSYPGIYASVSAHMQWIRQQTGLNL